MTEPMILQEAPPQLINPRGEDFHPATSGDHNLAIDTRWPA